jgi:hypothetical protein
VGIILSLKRGEKSKTPPPVFKKKGGNRGKRQWKLPLSLVLSWTNVRGPQLPECVGTDVDLGLGVFLLDAYQFLEEEDMLAKTHASAGRTDERLERVKEKENSRKLELTKS